MKTQQAIDIAIRWARGDGDLAEAIFRQQVALDPELAEDFADEAERAYVEKLIYEFLEQGYSLDRPDELVAAIGARLRSGPEG